MSTKDASLPKEVPWLTAMLFSAQVTVHITTGGSLEQLQVCVHEEIFEDLEAVCVDVVGR